MGKVREGSLPFLNSTTDPDTRLLVCLKKSHLVRTAPMPPLPPPPPSHLKGFSKKKLITFSQENQILNT